MSPRAVSVRWRLTFWYSAVLAVLLLVFSTAVYLVVRENLSRQLDRDLAKEFDMLAGEIAEEPEDIREIEPEGSVRLFRVVRDGRMVFESAPFRAAALPGIAMGPAPRYETVRAGTGTRYRILCGPLKDGGILMVALDEEAVRQSLGTLLLILALALPGALAAAAAGGYLLAGRLLRPVDAMARRAATIPEENLAARLPVANPGDEFGRLAGVFNRTLARLEDAFERLRRFTADASHELRTPLAAIQSVGEVALREDLDGEAYRDRIGSMLEETARLTRLADSLLLLTRAENGSVRPAGEVLDTGETVERSVDDLRVLAEEKGQTLRTDLPRGLRVRVDEELIRRALGNIIDNAIKFTPAGGTIDVRAAERGGEIVITVADTGPGVPAEHRERIFERFYRIERDRPRDAGGAGLGLAIARRAVEANGGRIEVENRPGPGAEFRIVLPKSPGTGKESVR
jgi:heavy metal sensor kinase